MKILKLFFADYPWDVRVEKIGRTLARAGHEVHLLCRNLKNAPALEQTPDFTIHRLPVKNALASTPVFVNPVWRGYLARKIREIQPDVLMVRDLPLALAATSVGHRFGLPVVFDMAENYPAALAEWRKWESLPRRIANFVPRNVTLARAAEKLSARAADHVLVVADEQRDRMVAIGVDPSRVTLVGNTPELDLFSPPAPDSAQRQRYDVLYIGEIHWHRGLDVAIRAMPRLLSCVPYARLVLVGDGKSTEGLMQLAADMGVADSVVFPGWAEWRELPAIISRSDVGLVPHYASEHTDTTLPNKLFDYMALRCAVVVSDAAPLKRVVEKERCGLVFRSGDDAGLADALVKLSEPSARGAMARNGRDSVEREYNWECDTRRLLHVLETVKAPTGPR